MPVMSASDETRDDRSGQPRQAEPGTSEGGFPEPQTEDAEDRSRDTDPHHALNNPVGEPDPTEWPDPYEKRPDPKDGPDPANGAHSTSEPHPSQDPEAGESATPPERDNLDD
jgi:hypothetical protein